MTFFFLPVQWINPQAHTQNGLRERLLCAPPQLHVRPQEHVLQLHGQYQCRVIKCPQSDQVTKKVSMKRVTSHILLLFCSPSDALALRVPCARVSQPPCAGVLVLLIHEHLLLLRQRWSPRDRVPHHRAQVRERTLRSELLHGALVDHWKRPSWIQLQLDHLWPSARRHLQALLVPRLRTRSGLSWWPQSRPAEL